MCIFPDPIFICLLQGVLTKPLKPRVPKPQWLKEVSGVSVSLKAVYRKVEGTGQAVCFKPRDVAVSPSLRQQFESVT